MRKTTAFLVLGLAPVLYLRRLRGSTAERVSLHYDDGSAVTLERGAPEFDRLLALGRDALALANG